jgi:hypothetical protein
MWILMSAHGKSGLADDEASHDHGCGCTGLPVSLQGNL